MEYVWLIMVVVLLSLQNFLAKEYERRTKHFNIWMFSGITTLGALLFFLINAGFSVSYAPELVPYAVGFATFFGSSMAGLVMAIRTGMFSLSSLMTSYSLIIPTLYGILFLGDSIGAWGYSGIVLLLISLYLLNGKKQDGEHFSFRWLLWVLIAFAGNGLCSTVQKMQQLAFEGGYKNELMIYAMALLTVVFLLAGFLTGKNRKAEIKDAALPGLFRGAANGIVNYFVMVLTGVLPTAIVFPMISAGGIVVAFVLAITIYKEKLSGMQVAGYIIGTASVILLNL